MHLPNGVAYNLGSFLGKRAAIAAANRLPGRSKLTKLEDFSKSWSRHAQTAGRATEAASHIEMGSVDAALTTPPSMPSLSNRIASIPGRLIGGLEEGAMRFIGQADSNILSLMGGIDVGNVDIEEVGGVLGRGFQKAGGIVKGIYDDNPELQRGFREGFTTEFKTQGGTIKQSITSTARNFRDGIRNFQEGYDSANPVLAARASRTVTDTPEDIARRAHTAQVQGRSHELADNVRARQLRRLNHAQTTQASIRPSSTIVESDGTTYTVNHLMGSSQGAPQAVRTLNTTQSAMNTPLTTASHLPPLGSGINGPTVPTSQTPIFAPTPVRTSSPISMGLIDPTPPPADLTEVNQAIGNLENYINSLSPNLRDQVLARPSSLLSRVSSPPSRSSTASSLSSTSSLSPFVSSSSSSSSNSPPPMVGYQSREMAGLGGLSSDSAVSPSLFARGRGFLGRLFGRGSHNPNNYIELSSSSSSSASLPQSVADPGPRQFTRTYSFADRDTSVLVRPGSAPLTSVSNQLPRPASAPASTTAGRTAINQTNKIPSGSGMKGIMGMMGAQLAVESMNGLNNMFAIMGQQRIAEQEQDIQRQQMAFDTANNIFQASRQKAEADEQMNMNIAQSREQSGLQLLQMRRGTRRW